MKKVILFVYSVSFSVVLNAQTEFENFISMFPDVTWTQLDSLVQLDWENIKVNNLMRSDYVNENMMSESHYEGNQQAAVNCYYTNICRPPFVKLSDGNFFYTNDWGKYDEDMFLSPIGKYKVNSNVVMLILLCKFVNLELVDYKYETHLEAYTFRLNDEQKLSALCIYLNPYRAYGAVPTKCVFFNPDSSITAFETFFDTNRPVDGPEGYDTKIGINRYVFNDGYFKITYTDSDHGDLKEGIVSDPDGYVNLREKPNTKSRVLTTVPSGTKVWVETIKNSNWCILRKYETKNGFCPIRFGFVYKNRIKFTGN